MYSILVLALLVCSAQAALHFERAPSDGIQPQLVVDLDARIHLMYFKGEAMGGDIFYVTRSADEKSFSKPIQINAKPGSVIVAGTMRGPQMALGESGRVHVVWMGGNGADKAEVAGEKVTPLLYARLADSRDRFEPERNILTHIAGLDGGQSVAADNAGNVYVVWHGAPPGVEGEDQRGLYLARSEDEGKNFAREEKAKVPRTGSCACCGIRARVDDGGTLHVLFRSAEEGVNRPELWLKSTDHGKSFTILQEDPWKTATCPASSASFSFVNDKQAAAWETDNQVVAALRSGAKSVALKPGGKGKQKHPTIAVNQKGEALLTWVEDAGWGNPGTLVCQVFSADGKPVGELIRKKGLPAWSFGAPYVDKNGDFVVIY